MNKTEAQQIFIQQLSDLEENEVLATVHKRLAKMTIPWPSSRMHRKGCAGLVCATSKASIIWQR